MLCSRLQNPVTGEKAFQGENLFIRDFNLNSKEPTLNPSIHSSSVHPIAARQLRLKLSPTAEESLVTDIAEVRRILYDLQHPLLRPENIFAPPYEEGDLVIFYNRGSVPSPLPPAPRDPDETPDFINSVFHAATEYPLESHGPRTMHQAQCVLLFPHASPSPSLIRPPCSSVAGSSHPV